jgi:hypothetical protein
MSIKNPKTAVYPSAKRLTSEKYVPTFGVSPLVSAIGSSALVILSTFQHTSHLPSVKCSRAPRSLLHRNHDNPQASTSILARRARQAIPEEPRAPACTSNTAPWRTRPGVCPLPKRWPGTILAILQWYRLPAGLPLNLTMSRSRPTPRVCHEDA